MDEANEKADKQIMQIRLILNKSEQGHQREMQTQEYQHEAAIGGNFAHSIAMEYFLILLDFSQKVLFFLTKTKCSILFFRSTNVRI